MIAAKKLFLTMPITKSMKMINLNADIESESILNGFFWSTNVSGDAVDVVISNDALVISWSVSMVNEYPTISIASNSAVIVININRSIFTIKNPIGLSSWTSRNFLLGSGGVIVVHSMSPSGECVDQVF